MHELRVLTLWVHDLVQWKRPSIINSEVQRSIIAPLIIARFYHGQIAG